MARWDILQRENARDSELGPSREERRQESSGTGVSVGRGPTDGSSGAHRKGRSGRVKAPQSGRQIAGPNMAMEAEPILCVAQRLRP